MPKDKIEEGVKIIAKVIEEFLQKKTIKLLKN